MTALSWAESHLEKVEVVIASHGISNSLVWYFPLLIESVDINLKITRRITRIIQW